MVAACIASKNNNYVTNRTLKIRSLKRALSKQNVFVLVCRSRGVLNITAVACQSLQNNNNNNNNT